ncbi:MAG: MFS transporter [Myxococcota bacterium]|nr:MFS transporter [Myxococcota bacterium]
MTQSSEDSTTAARNRSTLPILFSVIIVDLIGFGIVIPILPAYTKDLGASAGILGMLLATHAALQFIFAPIWGRASDRFGRRPVMLLTIAGTCGALLMLGLAESILGLFISRLLSGLFSANISVATAYVADVTDESERTRWMGMVGASFGVGFILGPALGGLLHPFSASLPAFVAAGLAGINLVWAAFTLREPERHAGRAIKRAGLRAALADPVVARICITNLFFTVGVSQLESTFFYWMSDEFGYSVRQVAYILVAMAVVMAGIQGGGIRSLVNRLGEKRMLVSGLVLMALAFPVIPSVHVVGLLLIPLAVSALGRAIAQPPMTSLISMRGEASGRGELMGFFQSSAALARIFGPLVAGFLYDLSGTFPFYLAGGLFAIGALLSLGLQSTDTPRPENA